MTSRRNATFLLAGLVSSAAAADPFARADAVMVGNLNSQPLGSETALMGSTSVARGDGVDAPWANPAGLGIARAAYLEMSGTVYQLSRTRLEGELAQNNDFTVRVVPAFTSYSTKRYGTDIPYALAVYSVIRSDWSHDTVLSQVRFPSGSDFRYQINTSGSYFAWEGGLAAGLELPGTGLRLGAALAAVYNEYERSMAMSLTEGSPIIATTTSQSAESMVAIHLRPVLALQYDVLPQLTLGGTARFAGSQIFEQGSVNSAYQRIESNQAFWMMQYDDEVAVHWPVPAECTFGACWNGGTAGMAAEWRWTGGRGRSAVIHSDIAATGALVAFDGTVTPWSQPVPDEVADGSATQGWAVGGWYAFNPRFRLLGGIWSDPSPASDNDTLFTRMDLYGSTLGTGFAWDRNELLVGVSATWGHHDDYIILPGLDADVRVLNLAVVMGTHLAF